MAHRPKSYKVIPSKKQLIIYTNVEDDQTESKAIDSYLKNGYIALYDEKKKSETIDDMRKSLEADKKVLDEFNRLYKSKEEGEGYFAALKLYQNWKKANKKK